MLTPMGAQLPEPIFGLSEEIARLHLAGVKLCSRHLAFFLDSSRKKGYIKQTFADSPVSLQGGL